MMPPRAILAAPRIPRRKGSFCKAVLLRSLVGEALHLRDYSVELLDDGVRAGGLESFDQRPIVPERTVSAAVEPLPELVADGAQTREYGPSVVQLVRRGDEPHGLRLVGYAGHVPLFALAPGRFWVFEGVGVAGYDTGDLVAEPIADVLESVLAALILGGVV